MIILIVEFFRAPNFAFRKIPHPLSQQLGGTFFLKEQKKKTELRILDCRKERNNHNPRPSSLSQFTHPANKFAPQNGDFLVGLNSYLCGKTSYLCGKTSYLCGKSLYKPLELGYNFLIVIRLYI